MVSSTYLKDRNEFSEVYEAALGDVTGMDMEAIEKAYEEGKNKVEVMPPNEPMAYRSKLKISEELQKLKRLLYLGEITHTDTPEKLYRTGRIKLYPVEINRAMNVFYAGLPQETVEAYGMRGIRLFDFLLERSVELLDDFGGGEIIEQNRTILTIMQVLEKKTDWLERFGMKPKEIEQKKTEDEKDLSIENMRRIFQNANTSK